MQGEKTEGLQSSLPEVRDFCPVREYINVLQEKWVMHIVRALLDGTKGFNELGREAGGANPRTLSQRLERLERLGIVEKHVHSTMPPRTEYCLTQAGAELDDVISAIDRWSRRHAGSLPEAVTEEGDG
jgi:DNA-binding HxlR family transcriptional regulator